MASRKKNELEYRVLDMIAATIFVVQEDGGQYITRTQARNEDRERTSLLALGLLSLGDDFEPTDEQSARYKQSLPSLRDQASAAIAWCASMQVREVKNDEGMTIEHEYERTIRAFARTGVFKAKEAGRVSSIWPAYQRHLNRAPKPEYLPEFLGTVGEKIEVVANLIRKKESGTCFGVSLRVELRDDAGHLLMWWCSTPARFDNIDAGDLVRIKGTVKDHTVYGSAHQTLLTRCKVELLSTADRLKATF